jgi:hypothetical protein
MRCFYYMEAFIWFSPWCFIWVDLAHAYTCLTLTSCHKPLWSFGFWLVMPLYASFNDVLSLCMIMAIIALLVGRSQSFASLHFLLSMSSTHASNSQKPCLQMCPPYIPTSILLSKVHWLANYTLFGVMWKLISKALTNLTAHFTFLAFKILTLWLSYVDVMLASCKLEISPTMPSWGKLSTLHFLSFELISWSFVYGYSRCEISWDLARSWSLYMC